MTNNDTKQIRDAFTRLCKAKVTFHKKEMTAFIETDFTNYNKEKIGFYGYMLPSSGKIYFTDAGRTNKLLLSANQTLQPGVMQGMIDSYGLTWMPDLTILDQQDKPMHDRLAAMIQVQIGADLLVRSWKAYEDKVKVKLNERSI